MRYALQTLGQLPHPETPTTGLPYAPAEVAQRGPSYNTPYGVVSPYGNPVPFSQYNQYGPYGVGPGQYQANLTTTTTFDTNTLLLLGGLAAAFYFITKKH